LTALAFASSLVILSVALYIVRFGVNLPFWDQWEVVSLLANLEKGAGTWAMFVQQHNEHRPVFPRLIWTVLASFTNYNIIAELWLNFSLALATFFVVILRLRAIVRAFQPHSVMRATMFPVMSLLIFNLEQWESWLMGFQTVMYLGMFCVIAGLLLLGAPLNWGRWTLALLLGIIAIFSFANGLLFPPLGFFLVCMFASRPARLPMLVLWTLVFIAVTGYYLHSWNSPALISKYDLARNSFRLVRWFLYFIGSPLLNNFISQYAGAASVLLFGYLVRRSLQQGKFRLLASYWAVALFVLASGLLIALGRSSESIYSALAPRYITITAWYWLVLFVAAVLLVPYRRVLTFCILVLVLFLGVSTWQGARAGVLYRYQVLFPVYELIRAGAAPDDATLQTLYAISPGVVRERLGILCDHHWSACSLPVQLPDSPSPGKLKED
jgi:hypothetical protein